MSDALYGRGSEHGAHISDMLPLIYYLKVSGQVTKRSILGLSFPWNYPVTYRAIS